MADVSAPSAGGFQFDLCRRNEHLSKKGVAPPAPTKTGTTIAGILFKVRSRSLYDVYVVCSLTVQSTASFLPASQCALIQRCLDQPGEGEYTCHRLRAVRLNGPVVELFGGLCSAASLSEYCAELALESLSCECIGMVGSSWTVGSTPCESTRNPSALMQPTRRGIHVG